MPAYLEINGVEYKVPGHVANAGASDAGFQQLQAQVRQLFESGPLLTLPVLLHGVSTGLLVRRPVATAAVWFEEEPDLKGAAIPPLRRGR